MRRRLFNLSGLHSILLGLGLFALPLQTVRATTQATPPSLWEAASGEVAAQAQAAALSHLEQALANTELGTYLQSAGTFSETVQGIFDDIKKLGKIKDFINAINERDSVAFSNILNETLKDALVRMAKEAATAAGASAGGGISGPLAPIGAWVGGQLGGKLGGLLAEGAYDKIVGPVIEAASGWLLGDGDSGAGMPPSTPPGGGRGGGGVGKLKPFR